MTQKTRCDEKTGCLVGMCWRWNCLCYSDKEKKASTELLNCGELWQHDRVGNVIREGTIQIGILF